MKANSKIVPSDELKTFDFGTLEGKKQTAEENKRIHENIINNPDSTMHAEGETFNGAFNRVVPKMNDIIEKAPANTAVVTHNSVYGLIKLWDKENRPESFDRDQREKYTKQDNKFETGEHFTIQGKNGPIHIVRHGETKDNVAKNFRKPDTELTGNGIKQAKEVGKLLGKHDIPQVISSPLPRAIHTSNLILDQQSKKNFRSGGWLDNYGEEENANEGKIVAGPKESLFSGTSNKGRNYSPAWGGQFQDGGDIPGEWFGEEVYNREPNMMEARPDPEFLAAMRGMMKSKMASQAALGNPAAKRLFSLTKEPYHWTGKEKDWQGNPVDVEPGSTGTHFMGSWGNYAVPGIQERGGELQYVQDPQQSDRESMYFDRPEDAEYFGTHYKEVAPVMRDYGKFMGGGSMPGTVGFTYARTGAPTEGKYAKKTMASAQSGKVIDDDRGQWEHPGEITRINSNHITMRGVPYPVMGISDTGDKKLMHPGKNYAFNGNRVTEFPMLEAGGNVRQEQKGKVNLDNLLNFTNYNTPQPGGWLDKY